MKRRQAAKHTSLRHTGPSASHLCAKACVRNSSFPSIRLFGGNSICEAGWGMLIDCPGLQILAWTWHSVCTLLRMPRIPHLPYLTIRLWFTWTIGSACTIYFQCKSWSCQLSLFDLISEFRTTWVSEWKNDDDFAIPVCSIAAKRDQYWLK